MRSRRCILPLVAAVLGPAPAGAEPQDGREPAPVTLGVEVFVVVRDAEPVVSRAWLDREVAHANALFAPAGARFRVVKRHKIGARFAHVAERRDRDALGAHPLTPGLVHVFVVDRLDDVDIEGNRLFGVHWRYRRDRRHTWVILSTRDDTGTVLAHELGHMFGLGHSRYRRSVMNKRPRERPPWPERVFVPPEIRRVRRHVRRLTRSGRLEPRATPGGDARPAGAFQ